MSTNIKKLKSFIKNHKEEEARKKERKQSSVDFYRNKLGKNILFLCPPHDNMDELPFVLRGKHRNCGPESKTDFMCVSCDGKNLKDCPQCVEVRELYSTGRERDKVKANKMRRNQRYYWQVIDVFPIGLGEEAEIPSCFLDCPSEEEEKKRTKRSCNSCNWLDSCAKGIQAWSIGSKIQDSIIDELDELSDDEDITNPKAAKPLSFRRKGEDVTSTEYSGIKFLKTIRFPKEVIERIHENLIDLSQVSIPKDADTIRELMTGTPTEEVTEDDAPKCFGKYDDEEDECLKCDFCDSCEVETKGVSKSKKSSNFDDDEEEDEDELNSESNITDDEDDPLENKIKELAEKRKAERQAVKRTPITKDEDDEDDD